VLFLVYVQLEYQRAVLLFAECAKRGSEYVHAATSPWAQPSQFGSWRFGSSRISQELSGQFRNSPDGRLGDQPIPLLVHEGEHETKHLSDSALVKWFICVAAIPPFGW